MLVIGIESTCDETGIAIVRNGKEILSNSIANQEMLHAHYGGVVPELACRRHIDTILPLFKQATTHITAEQIDLIAVANGPGLIGAILIGLNFAKGLALAIEKPLVSVNHVEAHLYSSFMHNQLPPQLPAIGAVLSGGHTSIILIHDIGCYQILGETQDDAIGEAFDKVARLLDLPYPGGPHIERLAKKGDPHRFSFKAGQFKSRPYDFSFSGLKTALLYLIKGKNNNKNAPSLIHINDKNDIAASFQFAAFTDVVKKIELCTQKFPCKSIIIGGGVSQNQYFRQLLTQKNQDKHPIYWPPEGLCTDNGAMIAGLGYHLFQQEGATSKLLAHPRLDLRKTPLLKKTKKTRE